MALSGGGALVAVSRRMQAAEADQKAEADMQAVDLQQDDGQNPLTTDQAGAAGGGAGGGSVGGAGGDSDEDRDGVPEIETGAGGVPKSPPSSHSDASGSQNFFGQRDQENENTEGKGAE